MELNQPRRLLEAAHMLKTSRAKNKPEIKAIIFDIGRVIVRLDPGRAIAAIGAGSKLSPDKVWAAVPQDPMWQGWQEGRVTPKDWYENVIARFHTPISVRRILWRVEQHPLSGINSSRAFVQTTFKKLPTRAAFQYRPDPRGLHGINIPFYSLLPSERIYSCDARREQAGT